MFKRILIANRGEIATRIVRTCRDLGIETIALYQAPDRNSLHVRLADYCAELSSDHGYMDKTAILDVARRMGADAIHPGYGFLAERPDFIAACDDAGIAFIGPPADVVARSQCKTDALAAARAAGYATPESSPRSYGPDELPAVREEAERLGYPLVIKSCVGGRGRGSRFVPSPGKLEEAVRWALMETQRVYGDNLVYLERAMAPVRNIAVQILCDNHGNMVHLGERDGSAQLGNQKVISEQPAPGLSPEQRQRLWQAALELACLFNCRSAANVEFLVDEAGNFYFTEVKPRIGIDHPVSEIVTGVDIVREQIRIAAGEPLGYGQDDVRLDGWAMGLVITAQDPWHDFRPSPGYLRRVRLPGGPRVRVDTFVYSRCDVPALYDPILAKVIVWGANREECLRRADRALQDFTIIGVPTNLPFQQSVLKEPAFITGNYSTSLLQERTGSGSVQDETYLRDLAVAAAIAFARRNLMYRPSVPEQIRTGWHRSIRQLPE